MKIILVLFFVTFTYGISIDSQISGGSEANPNQFPFAIAVFTAPNAEARERLCGGALISRQAILSAAVCVHNQVTFRVGLGIHDWSNEAEPFVVWMSVSDVRVHPSYPQDLTNNIAILRLPHSIGFFNQAVQIISLPSEDQQFLNTAGNAVGWGCSTPLPSPALCTQSFVLRSISISTVTCAAGANQICAGGALTGSICAGDEGGPFFTTINGNFVLIGLGHSFPGGCIGTSTFTRVSSHLAWIRANM